MEYFYIAQIFGLLALCGEIIRFQIKNSKNFFYFEPFLSSAYFMQFMLLGAVGAYYVSMISIVRAICGVTLSQKYMKWAILYIFIPVYTCTLMFIDQSNLMEYLPVLAIWCSSYAFINREHRSFVTRLYIANASLWAIYTFYVGAYASMLAFILILTSLMIGILRHEKLGLTEAKQTS